MMIKFRSSLILFALATSVIFVGCGPDTYDAAMNDTIKIMNRYVTVLEGVKDEASAKAAKTKFEAIATELKALKARTDKLGDPDEATQKRLEEKFKSQMEATQKRMQEAMMNLVKQPQVMMELQNSMKAMTEMGPAFGQ